MSEFSWEVEVTKLFCFPSLSLFLPFYISVDKPGCDSVVGIGLHSPGGWESHHMLEQPGEPGKLGTAQSEEGRPQHQGGGMSLCVQTQGRRCWGTRGTSPALWRLVGLESSPGGEWCPRSRKESHSSEPSIAWVCLAMEDACHGSLIQTAVSISCDWPVFLGTIFTNRARNNALPAAPLSTQVDT